ncbi:reticulon-1a isoform X1 [Girardinichthys multiradiatus]|uniref:reticulon-1a isoform X1 n=1 Tax=Girardinichthys multiradiatus TaxID=208333 RepID=UPI001FACD118|nr:reticulon-1a isoform X1 [Girardinichthys multiradiatus]
MSAQPGEDLGSEGRWFGDDRERNGLMGNTAPRFGEEFKPRGGDATADLDHQQFHPFQADGKRPPVAMETASTDDPMSGLFRKSMNDEGDVYTSLLSNQSFTAYLSDDLKPSNHSAGSSPLDDFTSDTYSFTSKTKTASTLSDIPKSLLGSDKTDSYNYMDISHGEEHCGSRGSADHDLLGSYMDQNPGRDEDDEENLGPALGSHSFPYVEDPSDEELNDYRSYRNLGSTPQTASPVKISLTGSQPSKAEPQLLPSPVGVSERENVLSVGLQGVPMVTLSEPEDDSPASTPNASPTRKQFSSEDMFKVESRKPPASRSNQGPKPSSRDHEGSSAESGDSEIELVSEELPKASSHSFTEEPKNKVTFSQPNNPFDDTPVTKAGFGLAGSPASPTTYSILREEREAELDSDLIIESASEESPKREQGIQGPKQGAPLPSPLVSSTSPPRSTPKAVPVQPLIAEKAKNPVKAEEDRPSKPKPPTAAVPPEVRSEKPQQDDMHKPLQQDKEELGKPAVAMLLEGFNKQKAIDLLYWRNVKQSGAVFSSVLLLLFSLTQFSVVSVGAYLALAALSATISFRIYKSVLQAVQKTDEGHPFKGYLEMEIALSQDQISKYADKILLYSNTCMKELRRLFLVQDLVDSLKFAVLMWLLTYVGALFNGLTLLILAVVSMFTLPVVYEKHQAQIDQYVGLIRTQVNSVVVKIQAKIPGAKRKEE